MAITTDFVVWQNEMVRLRALAAKELESLTKEQAVAMGETRGTLYHRTLRNADGTALRARVNGKCQTWATRPEDFLLPMKHGLYDTFRISHNDATNWTQTEPVYTTR